MKRNVRLIWLVFCVLMFSLTTAFAQGDKAKEIKITGKLVSAPADPSGKLAPLAIECKDGTYPVLNNAIAKKKMAKHVGKMLDITGAFKELDGKKVFDPWVVVPAGAKPKKQPIEG